MVWHGVVQKKLQASGLFTNVSLIGAKVRAAISETLFLDVHYDPTTNSYSYALIDLASPYVGDKRILGWDDYPHEGVEAIEKLPSYPHHFQRRASTGEWIFEVSEMRGDIEQEMDPIVDTLRKHLGL
jgi:hypothetical protein